MSAGGRLRAIGVAVSALSRCSQGRRDRRAPSVKNQASWPSTGSGGDACDRLGERFAACQREKEDRRGADSEIRTHDPSTTRVVVPPEAVRASGHVIRTRPGYAWGGRGLRGPAPADWRPRAPACGVRRVSAPPRERRMRQLCAVGRSNANRRHRASGEREGPSGEGATSLCTCRSGRERTSIWMPRRPVGCQEPM